MRVKPGVVYHRGKTRSVIYFKEAEELAANFKELEGGKITAILFPINKNGIGEDLSSGLLLCESTGAKRWRTETAQGQDSCLLLFLDVCTAAAPM